MLTVILWIAAVAIVGGILLYAENMRTEGIQMQEDAIRKLKYGY